MTKAALTRAYGARGPRIAANFNFDLAAMLNAAEAPEKTQFVELARTEGLRKAQDCRNKRFSVLIG